jgi:hypothetical protein
MRAQDTIQTPKDGGCSSREGDCGTYIAVPFFITYILAVSIILLNLFTAVVIETFEKVGGRARAVRCAV